MEYPVTTEIPLDDPRYAACLSGFYTDVAGRLRDLARAGEDIVVLCEGDPFFYGSFMHLYTRLRDDVPVEVVPAITGMSAAWTATGIPVTWGDDVLTVLLGTMAEPDLTRRMAESDAIIVMKVGRNLPKVRAALQAAGKLDAAWLVECASMAEERAVPLAQAGDRTGAVFLDRGGAWPGAPAMSGGWLVIAGLGPGDAALVTPEVQAALAEATDIVGYIPYVRRVADRPGLTRHETGNREEIARARHALDMAAAGQRVVVVSSGDPGVFAMAAAVFEAVEAGPEAYRALDIRVLPGVTAMLAAAARAGAPLGHDFCAINLSDNLKPWDLIERRLTLAVEADFAMALYNPRSKARPEGFGRALELLRGLCEPERVLIFARAVSTEDEALGTVTLAEAMPEMADMRTVVLIGARATRVIPNTAFVYTPRSAE